MRRRWRFAVSFGSRRGGVFRVSFRARRSPSAAAGAVTRSGARAVPRSGHRTSVIRNSLAGNTRR
jgi:hypothetical protein